MIKAVLFDFDGTLADTNALIIRTFQETFAQLLPARPISEADILDCIGPTLMQTGEVYLPGNGGLFVDTYQSIQHLYHDEMITLYPGIVGMLQTLKDHGLRLAIISSKRRGFLERGLKRTGIFDFFDFVLGGDEVENPKPHSEPITRALGFYRLSPENCLMVGDNAHDIQAAKVAGVKSIAVGWAYKGQEYLQAFQPTYLVQTAAEIVDIATGQRA